MKLARYLSTVTLKGEGQENENGTSQEVSPARLRQQRKELHAEKVRQGKHYLAEQVDIGTSAVCRLPHTGRSPLALHTTHRTPPSRQSGVAPRTATT